MLHTKFVKEWCSSFYRTTNDDGRQPIAIGNLSDSSRLKMWIPRIYWILLNYVLCEGKIFDRYQSYLSEYLSTLFPSK